MTFLQRKIPKQECFQSNKSFHNIKIHKIESWSNRSVDRHVHQNMRNAIKFENR